jgi:NAD(P)-dependent dehydrogenase (short-subunit alcohol dehydrogenase family)
MNERVCLITGGTEGIGKATAIGLARKGLRIVLAARNPAKAEAVKREIALATGRTDTDHVVADLTSLRQVHELAETFKQRYPRLDVLINNAGIFMPMRRLTEDGYESTYQVNYLSQFMLTQLLLDELAKSPDGRIVNLSSSAYTLGRFDPDNLQSERQFSTFAAYAASKLFMLMFTIELAERLRGTNVTAYAVHPGVVRTQMMLRAPGFFRLIAYLALPFALSPQKGAATTVYVAGSPNVRSESGKYLTKCKPVTVRHPFITRPYREHLWNISMNSLERSTAIDAPAGLWANVLASSLATDS